MRPGPPRADSFPRTTELMRALTYVVNKAVELAMPVAVNLSFGNTYGAHNGTSLLERFIDNVSEIGRNVICVGSGNEGASGGHVGGSLRQQETGNSISTNLVNSIDTDVTDRGRRVEMTVGAYERGLNVQLWKEYADRYLVTVTSPAGERFQADTDRPGKQTYRLQQTQILFYNGEPAPYMTAQELYFDFLPTEGSRYLDRGVWTFTLQPLTIPSTSVKVVTVGAYDPVYESYADFSGRGYLYQDQVNGRTSDAFVKPDLVAPGVGVLAPDRYGGYAPVTGTSFAAPFVTGAAAVLMQWGIVMGNDPYLYGEKVKAYLRKGAKPIRGVAEYPDERVGYGALCVENSLPM